MNTNKDSGCLRILTIGAGLASIFGVIIALCAWLFPVQGMLSNFTSIPSPTSLPPDPPILSPTPCVWSPTHARLAAIKFFESGIDGVALEERVYTNYFSAETARRINWEVTIYYDCPPYQREPFIIEATYYKPDGSILGQYSSNTYADTGWWSSIHTNSWGWDEPGNWEVGRYKVSLKVAGLMEATDFFDIEP